MRWIGLGLLIVTAAMIASSSASAAAPTITWAVVPRLRVSRSGILRVRVADVAQLVERRLWARQARVGWLRVLVGHRRLERSGVPRTDWATRKALCPRAPTYRTSSSTSPRTPSPSTSTRPSHRRSRSAGSSLTEATILGVRAWSRGGYDPLRRFHARRRRQPSGHTSVLTARWRRRFLVARRRFSLT